MDAASVTRIDEFVIRIRPAWESRVQTELLSTVRAVGGRDYPKVVDSLHKEAEQRLNAIARSIELTARRGSARIDSDDLEAEFRRRTGTIKNEVLEIFTTTLQGQHLNYDEFTRQLTRQIDPAVEWTAEGLQVTARDLSDRQDEHTSLLQATLAQKSAADAGEKSAVAAGKAATFMKWSAIATAAGVPSQPQPAPGQPTVRLIRPRKEITQRAPSAPLFAYSSRQRSSTKLPHG